MRKERKRSRHSGYQNMTTKQKKSLCIISLFCLFPANVYATETVKIINGASDQMFTILKGIGAIIAIVGIMKMLMAYESDNGESRSQAILTMVTGFVLFGFETLYNSLNLAASTDTDATIDKILDLVFEWGKYVGVILLFYAVYKFSISQKNEDGEAKSKATISVAVSLALLCLKSIWTAIGGDTESPSPEVMIGGIVGLVCSVIQYAGAATALFAVGQFGSSLNDTDGGKKSTATMSLITGILMVVVPFIVKKIVGIE